MKASVNELIDETLQLFCNHYMDYQKLYEGGDINLILEKYCRDNEISEELANAMAVVINRDDDDEDDSDDDNSDDVVFTPDDLKNLSPDEIQNKRNAYITKLKNCRSGCCPNAPILKIKKS